LNFSPWTRQTRPGRAGSLSRIPVPHQASLAGWTVPSGTRGRFQKSSPASPQAGRWPRCGSTSWVASRSQWDGGREYVKVSPPAWAHHLVAERERLAWAARAYRGAGACWAPALAGCTRQALPGRFGRRTLSGSPIPRTGVRAIGRGSAAAARPRCQSTSFRSGPAAVGDRVVVVTRRSTGWWSATADGVRTQHNDRRRRPLQWTRRPRRSSASPTGGPTSPVAMLSLSWNYSGSWEGRAAGRLRRRRGPGAHRGVPAPVGTPPTFPPIKLGGVGKIQLEGH